MCFDGIIVTISVISVRQRLFSGGVFSAAFFFFFFFFFFFPGSLASC